MSTPQSLLSPVADEVFSTPPATPPIQEPPSQPSSRRNSRPTSLHIDHLRSAEWNSDIVLDTSPVANTNNTRALPPHKDKPDPSSFVNSQHRSRQHMNSQPINSPCFVHSHLDKGASLTDWLRTRTQVDHAATGDVGVARSLQRPMALNKLPNDDPPFLETNHNPASIDESDGEEDEFVGSLTKQLAETAVGVREMSKQLGRISFSFSKWPALTLVQVALASNRTFRASSLLPRPVIIDSLNSLAKSLST